jgi:hypothetical protein
LVELGVVVKLANGGILGGMVGQVAGVEVLAAFEELLCSEAISLRGHRATATGISVGSIVTASMLQELTDFSILLGLLICMPTQIFVIVTLAYPSENATQCSAYLRWMRMCI